MQSNIRTEIREFLKLAIPLASAQFAQAATGFVDTVMMGWLGQETLAAGGLAAISFTALLITAIGVVAGVSPLAAEAYGSDRKPRVGQVTRQGLWLSLLLSIPAMLLIGQMGSLISHLGQEATTVAQAKNYLNVILWGFFPATAFTVLRSTVSALSQARPVMVIVIVATLFNAVGNYVLGFGKLGFPQMGLAGLALASILAHWGMFLSLLFYMLRHQELTAYRLFNQWYKLEPRIIWTLVHVGIPIGIASALEVGLFTIVTYLMGMLGTEVLAAHQIVFQTIAVIFMVPLGMSFATAVRVGQWNGQNNLPGLRRAAYVGIGLAAMFMSVMAIVLLVYPDRVVGLYLDIRDPKNANVLKLALPMFTVAAISQILDGIQKTANGALIGLKDTRIPMLLSCFAFWGIGLTSGYLLGFPFGLAGVGLWVGQSIGVAVSAGVFIWRFQQLTTTRLRQPGSKTQFLR